MRDAWRVVVTRETEWDDETRDRVLNLAAYDQSMCPCGCGVAMSEATKDQPFVVDHFTCYATRAKERLRKIHQDEAKKNKLADGWDTGRVYFIRDTHEPDEAKEDGSA